MNKSILKFIIAIFVAGVLIGSAVSAQKGRSVPVKQMPAVVNEGFAFIGIEGIARNIAGSNRWFFVGDTDAANEVEVFKAGNSIELLPCSTLAQIAANSTNGVAAIRIWGKTTRYSNRHTLIKKNSGNHLEEKELAGKLADDNYLFAVYFMPLSTNEEEAAVEQEQEEEKTDKAAGKDSILPEDVMKMFKPKRAVKLTRKIIDVEGDLVTANRTGFILLKGDKKVFSIDGLGRNVDGIVFNILPCKTLENIEKSHAAKTGRQRFKISGIVTKFKGQYYVLLQRAVRTYNHGNFAR